KIKNRTILFVLLPIMLSVLYSGCTPAEPSANNGALIIQEQGSFAVGGTTISEPGIFDLTNSLRPHGQTFHGDHAYAFYQIPVNARTYPLIFLHGAGQSKKTWESTPDGREGFQNIFLRRNFGV